MQTKLGAEECDGVFQGGHPVVARRPRQLVLQGVAQGLARATSDRSDAARSSES
ncbi:MAG: hypothetical protein MZW92_24350 [Comamonadaceae bacterium]|nr:hypothetical protein [Comamonadaceae bacterium]